MSIVLNTELCWPLAAVGPNNAVVELFEHAGRGVGDNVSNPAKLPAILLPAHAHCCQPGCHRAWTALRASQSICTFTPSPFSRGTVPRAMPSPNIESTTVEPTLSTCPSASVSGWPRWFCRAAMRAWHGAARHLVASTNMFGGKGRPPDCSCKLQVTGNGGL